MKPRWLPLPTHEPLIPLAEMVAWIEAARLEAGPQKCPHCESTIAVTQTRRCYVCSETKLITAFARREGDPLGFDYRCKACKRTQAKVLHTERKRRLFREILGRSA